MLQIKQKMPPGPYGFNLEILQVASEIIKLSRRLTTNALISLCSVRAFSAHL